MSEVYLSNIAIDNFRTFGRFEVSLPPSPGLLLLTGTNGLGKSSFFDAIEWALTGKIRRFLPYVVRGKSVIPDADYLTRQGAEANTHAVFLQFSEGAPLQRSASEAPSLSAVSALLANPGRGEITDLSTHLAMTHFLGQAERQRFTSRESDDQWAALKGPSGVDRLELIRTRLRGKATTLAFGRRVKADAAAIAAIEKDIADWQGWLARCERLSQAVRAGGGLSPDDVRSRALEIEAELASLLQSKPVEISSETTSQHLARLVGIIEQATKDVGDRLARLGSADDIITRHEAQAALSSEDHPTLVRAREQLAAGRSLVTAAEERSKTARETVAAQGLALTSIEAEITRLEAGRTDLSRRAELLGLIGSARSELEAEMVAIEGHRRSVSEADSVTSTYAAARAEFAGLEAVAKQTADAVAVALRLAELVRIAEEREEELRRAQETSRAVASDMSTHIVRRDELMGLLEATKHELAEAERHASAITSAVASLASHIHHDDEFCPVCHAEYPPGQLKFLADEAARSSDARVATISANVERMEAELAEVGQRVRELTPIIALPARLEPSAKKARQDADTHCRTLAALLKVEATDDLVAAAVAQDDDARARLQAAEIALAEQAPTATAAAQRRLTSSAEIDRLTDRLAVATSRLNSLVTEDRDCGERIAARGLQSPTLEQVSKQLAGRREQLEAARRRLADLEQDADAAAVNFKTVGGQLANEEAALATAEMARAGANAALDQLAKQWRGLSLRGGPDRATLAAAQSSLSTLTNRLPLLSQRLQDLAQINQDVLLEEELKLVTQQMRSASDEEAVADPAAHLERLNGKLPAARAALRLSQDAEKAVDTYTVTLGERAEAYNREVLEPLNDRILEFNAAMLSTPGASVQFHANKRVDRTDFEMQLRYGDEVDNSLQRERKLPPQIILSEGQLAANGFSILCAASTAYRWSRWPALLLDDPLQHNDIIHTAAFVDVMRNLVELESYQLIMSSHDRAESDFISRKFDAAGLACTTVLLTAPAEHGVAFDPPSYNNAARQALEPPPITATADSA